MSRLPEDFRIGGTISAHRHEGGDCLSDWWHWEKKPGNVAGGAVSDPGAGHYGRYPEDFSLAQSLDHNAIFLSLSWARIESEPGKYDATVLDHYQEVFNSLSECGLEPICALWDVALPDWFVRSGGWSSATAPEYFRSYATAIVERLGYRCHKWVPMVEPEYWWTRAYLERSWPGGAGGSKKAMSNLLEAHIRAAKTIRSFQSDGQIGISTRIFSTEPHDPDSPWDFRAAERLEYRLNRTFMESLKKNTFDFVVATWGGVIRTSFSPWWPRRGFALTLSEEGRMISLDAAHDDAARYDEAIAAVLSHRVPIYMIGGSRADNDQQRNLDLENQLNAVAARTAGEEDSPIRGFFHHSLVDGFDWEHGYCCGKGLIRVSLNTLERTLTQNAGQLRDFVKGKEISLDAVAESCGITSNKEKFL